MGLMGFQDSPLSDPSIMVYFCMCLPEAAINDCNERGVRHGLSVIRFQIADDHDDGDSASSGIQQKPSTIAVNNQDTLLIDVTCI